MKKTAFLSIFAFLTLVSCRRDYTCTCVITQTEDGDSYSYTDVTTFNNVRKPEAIANCPEAPQTLNFGDGYSITNNCNLSKN